MLTDRISSFALRRSEFRVIFAALPSLWVVRFRPGLSISFGEATVGPAFSFHWLRIPHPLPFDLVFIPGPAGLHDLGLLSQWGGG